MKAQRVLLISGNYFPETTGIGKYNGEMMDWLSAHGLECGVVSTFPYYPFWKIQPPYEKRSFWYKTEYRGAFSNNPIKIHRCPHYVPRSPSGRTRILSDFSFFISAFLKIFVLLFARKYDYIITVAPPFKLGLLGYMYAKLKKAKLIYHIQDLQIDAAHELGMIRSKMLVNTMFKLERFILKKADFVSTISEGMAKKVKAKYSCRVLLFPNWTDTNEFRPILERKNGREQFNWSQNDKIVLYSGAIGEKQGLEMLLKTAHELSSYPDIKFIVCGSGPYKEKLIIDANKMKLTNVFFLPLQPYEKFNQFLNMVDVHLILQKSMANDFVMPSKLATVLSVGGLAVVSAEYSSTLHSIISNNRMGLLCKPDSQRDLSAVILKAVKSSHTDLRTNARLYAEKYLNINEVLSHYFFAVMQSNVSNLHKRLVREVEYSVPAELI